MSTPLFKDRPIHLVDIKDDGMFELTSEGISFLTSLKTHKVAVLSITGPYRSGKSFLANLLMSKSSGFKVGSTIKACTKGLWIWGRPIPLQHNRSLLIIDCEGLGSVEKDRSSNIDMKLFTLSVLLSSTIIYNTKHAISEDKIEELSNAANLTKRINISKDNKSNRNVDFADFFPELIWVLRDFSLDRGALSAKEYLEQCLRKVNTAVIEDGESKNICRDIITRNFKRRDCYTLVMPCTDEMKLRNLDTEPMSSIRKEFIEQVDAMITSIKNGIQPKKVSNVELDGEALFGLLQAYIEDINNEETPVILSALENVLLSKAKNISESVYEKFRDVITAKLDGQYPLNPEDIYTLFIESQSSLISDFSAQINDTISNEQSGSYILKLLSRMKDELELVLETNSAKFEELLEQSTALISTSVQYKSFTKLEEAKIFFLNFSNEIQNALTKYDTLPISDMTKQLIHSITNVLQVTLFDKLKKAGSSIEDLHGQMVSKLSAEVDDLNIKIRQLSDCLSQEKKITELKEKEIAETKVRLYELESKNDSLKRKNKEKEKEYMNNINTELQKYQKMESSYMNLMQEKDEKIALLQAQMAQLSNKSSKKSQELSKENIKLQFELKKMKECSDRAKSPSREGHNDNKVMNIQALFKSFQENIITFKEDLSKFEQEKENMFKEKYIQKCKEEIESKTKNWGEEISNVIKKQIAQISSNYEMSIKRLQEENEVLMKELEGVREENLNLAKYKISYEGSKQEVKELMQISFGKDDIIAIQKREGVLKDEQINELKLQKENLEIKLSEYITKYRIKEEEFEEVFLTIEGVFEKKKNKYEAHFVNLSQETQERFTQYSKKYKFKI